jgi:hypothetical protein
MTPEEQARAALLRQQLAQLAQQQHLAQLLQQQQQLAQFVQQQQQPQQLMLLGSPGGRHLIRTPSPPAAAHGQQGDATQQYSPASPGVTQHRALQPPALDYKFVRIVAWTPNDQQVHDLILARQLMQQQQQVLPGSLAGTHMTPTDTAATQMQPQQLLQQQISQPSSPTARQPGSPATPARPGHDYARSGLGAGATVDMQQGSRLRGRKL